MSKRKLTYKDFLNYFSNNLRNKDKYNFEKEMMRDAFEEEAYDGLSQLNEDELRNDIAELKAGISDKTKKNRRIVPVWFRYAASVVILLGVSITIVYLNSKHWQDSLLKEQVSHEMEIADSMIVEAERQIQKSDIKFDTIKKVSEQLIAESKEANKKAEIKPEDTKPLIVEDEVMVEEDLNAYDDIEADSDESIEITEFEEVEEVFKDEDFMVEEPQTEFEAMSDKPIRVEEAIAVESKSKISKQAKKSSNVRIRGVSSVPKGEGPLYVIDGIPVDLTNTITIVGKVLSAEDNSGIPGVSVILENLEVFGTTTDYNGDFSLIIPDDEELKILIASFVGMETQEISIEDDTTLLVYLESEMLAMDEVVVTGYGRNEETNYEDSEYIPAKPPNSISKNKYKKQILEKLDYSKLSEVSDKHKVKVLFTVREDGSLFNFNFRSIPDVTFSNEIKRAILELGNWIPATENGINISSNVKLILKIEINEY